MKYTIDFENGIAVVALEGQLDFSANNSFEELLDALKQNSPSGIVFDMSALSSIDSVGLGLLYIAREDFSGIQVSLRKPHGYVARLLDLTDAKKMFPIEA